jgi:hemolysin activation/secretion protein/AraC-like DNA-binding protein
MVTTVRHSCGSVNVERHLILQELTLSPSAEWQPHRHGWLIARVAEGTGYWLQSGVSARQLAAGDGLITTPNTVGALRASQLGPLKLQFFTVQPQYLNGVLTVAESHQFESAPENFPSKFLFFTGAELTGQKFARLAEQPQNDRLPMRCALLQLWAGAVANLLPPPISTAGNDHKLSGRFRQLVGRMTEAELSGCSLDDLAGQLHCSQRHFSRLFREAFGVPFRAHQIELRLQRARQLLANSDSKIINVAYDSGYHHLGLFNAMFKKRFGMTPGQWRRQKAPAQKRNPVPKLTVRLGIFLAVLFCNIFLEASAQTNFNPFAAISQTRDLVRLVASLKMAELTGEKKADFPAAVSTPAVSQNAVTNRPPESRAGTPGGLQEHSANRPPGFRVENYLVLGNSILPPETIGKIFTNVPAAFGTNVTIAGIRSVLMELQMAYRERGYATVSVALPQQKLTNATVKVQVIEGRLAAIHITGNRYYSSNNIMRALPDLKTNLLLNARVFQRELDDANLSRDRQIYPVIEPGLEPGTSDLTLKVKDQLPLHARLEINNVATPGTPYLRVNFNAQYDNLWDLDHQIGLQYSFTPENLKGEGNYAATPFDDPLVANYSAYYRLPLGGYRSVQEEVDANPGSFGYNEVTHQFNLPPPSNRPELNFYTSRSTSETGVQFGPESLVFSSQNPTNTFVVQQRDSGDNVTLNENLGARVSLPLPQIDKLNSTLSFGIDFKRFQMVSYNTNNFIQSFTYTNGNLGPVTLVTNLASGQPTTYTALDYLPLNVGLNGSIPDKFGTTFFNGTLNFNPFAFLSKDADFARAAYTTNARAAYVTLQMGADRNQTIYKDWTLKIHADGQWADSPLISNEQFAMGGVAGVRGYTDGESYGDSGWRVMLEPQTPLVQIGMIGNEGHESPCWVRGSVFMDYGEAYLIDPPAGSSGRQQFWGTGFGITVNAGDHFDARFSIACPLIATQQTPVGDVHFYFGVGIQF